MEVGVAAFLRATWVAGILPFILASIPTSKLKSFHGAISSVTNRGKTSSSMIKFTVPQRFFSHFYMVGAMWTTLLLFTTLVYAAFTMAPPLTSDKQPPLHSTATLLFEHRHRVWGAVLLLVLMEAHLLRRLYETLYVFRYRPSARMHVFLYLLGFYYYIAAPLSMCYGCAPEAFKFTLNLISEFMGEEGMKRMPVAIGVVDKRQLWESFVYSVAKIGWNQWVGSAIFIWGWLHQLHCHAILGCVRAHGEKADHYAIPRGDWFEIVSSPHYLAEIVIYFGLVVASGGGDLTIWLLFAAVVVNLLFSAAETHKWYLSKFEDYPTNRFAIIPFVF